MQGYRAFLVLCGWILLGSLLFGQAGEPNAPAADEETLQAANVKTDGPALLKFFRQRTLNPAEMIEIKALIQNLGAGSYRIREEATKKLMARGPVILKTVEKYLDHPDFEIAGRAKKIVQKIRKEDPLARVPAAAARLLEERKPDGAVQTLLDYLPFADNESVSKEVRNALAGLAVDNGKLEPALLEALSNKEPVIRAAAGEALALARVAGHRQKAWKLLDDPELLVRYRVAVAFVLSEESKAVPVLIDLLPELSQNQAWRTEDLLIRLAKGSKLAPPEVVVGTTKKTREEAKKLWAKWWTDNQNNINLAQLRAQPNLLGYTVMVLLDAGEIIEVGNNNEVRWKLSDLSFPLDVEVLPNHRVLIAEYHGGRVTERDLQGNVKWEKRIFGPLAAQRLDNGNTFIVTDNQLAEVNPQGNYVFTHSFPNGERIMKASKLDNGKIVCLTNNRRVVVLDRNRREQHSFQINLGKLLFGGRIHMTPTGRVLVPHNNENCVIEYDLSGKETWRLKVTSPIAAIRLPNGNTLVTTMVRPGRVVEYDRAGNEVWTYRTKVDSRITRAKRR